MEINSGSDGWQYGGCSMPPACFTPLTAVQATSPDTAPAASCRTQGSCGGTSGTSSCLVVSYV
jgi:hypothetical protein